MKALSIIVSLVGIGMCITGTVLLCNGNISNGMLLVTNGMLCAILGPIMTKA